MTASQSSASDIKNAYLSAHPNSIRYGCVLTPAQQLLKTIGNINIHGGHGDRINITGDGNGGMTRPC